ncbi:hypothetical protein VTN02DRAFT_790 [Thermoascus thermophilus]
MGAVWRVHVQVYAREEKRPPAITRVEIFPTRIDHVPAQGQSQGQGQVQVNLLPREDGDHAWVTETVTRLSRELGTTTVRDELGEQGQVVVDC